MGNAVLKGRKTFVPPLLDETRVFSLWTIEDVKELYRRFQSQVFGFALVEAQFESIISFKESVAEHVPLEKLFAILDNDNDGRVDGLELLGGLTLCCHATFEEKARFCFELFDFNLNSVMSQKELVIMMMSSVCGMNLLTGGGEELEPELEVFEAMAEDAVMRADMNSDGQIDFSEFLYWARSNRDLMAGLEALSRISMEAKKDIDPEDSAEETDDADLSEEDKFHNRQSTLLGEGIVVKTSKNVGSDRDSLLGGPFRGDQSGNPGAGGEVAPWKSQIFEPTNYKRKKGSNDGPDTNLELAWAFGYKAPNCRNNARFIGNSDSEQCIVYFTAALAVVYNPRLRTQIFYMGHRDAISCLAMHPSNQIVATADIKSNIHIWSLDKEGAITALSVIKGIVKEGVLHVAFAPSGDRIATVGRDTDHTLTIHDVNSGEIISSAKGLASPSNVFDIAYCKNGAELVMVGNLEVKFYLGVNTTKRAIESHPGKIGSKGKKQTFFCCTYMGEDAIVGCASGEIYRFHNAHCIDIVQAHSVRECVLSIFYNETDGTLVTGGKDCLVKFWDSTLKAVAEPIDISEDVDGDGRADNGSLNCAIMSLQQHGEQLLIGTRGCDIFEVSLPKRPGGPHSMSRVAWGHAEGELWGLACHPLREEFATCGDDKTIRIWSIRSREQLNIRLMPEVSRSLAYSPNGEIICLGMLDGSMALMECNSPALRVYATWKHSDAIITDIKFSPDGTYIAAGSADSNIYIYKSLDKKNFKRQAVCRGHIGAITHLDFSLTASPRQPYIQSNGSDKALLYWDIEGNQVKNSTTMRDVTWATFTCTLGWPVQGIWPEGCEYTDVNSCMVLPDIGDLVTGDDFHKVKLYKYPALRLGALHQTYVGHSSHVTCVRFSANKRYVVSIGGGDRTVLLWRHVVEEPEDSDVEGADASSSSASASSSNEDGGGADGGDLKNEIADVGPRSIEQEAVNLGWTVQELREYVQMNKQNGAGTGQFRPLRRSTSSTGGSGEVLPWRGNVVEPSRWTPAEGSTDVDLELAWVHGYRARDCRNNVHYSASGCIVYNAAALAVVHNKGTAKQQYLLGAHIDEVLGICSHPAGQIFASGEAGRQPSIVIWNSKDMQVLSRIEKAHERGVPLLAFNSKGNILASVGLDGDSSLCLHEWMKGVQILKTPTDKNKVLCCCFLANGTIGAALGSAAQHQQQLTTSFSGDGKTAQNRDILVTAGVKHLKFWWAQGQNVQSQRALWGTECKEKQSTIMCVASASPHICVTGSDMGSLIIWQNFKAVCNVRNFVSLGINPDDIEPPAGGAGGSAGGAAGASTSRQVDHDLRQSDVEYPHRSAVLCIYALPGIIADDKDDVGQCVDGYQQAARYITGDRDGVVAIWRMVQTHSGNLRLILMKTFSTMELKPKPLEPTVRSICERDGILLLGLHSSEIFEVPDSQFPFVIMPKLALGLVASPIKTIASSYSPAVRRGPSGFLSAETPKMRQSFSESSFVPRTSIVSHRLNIGHSSGEVWGLAMHPSLPVFITAGDDSTIKCWNLETNRMLSILRLPDKCRSIDISPDADSFAFSLNNGAILEVKLQVLLNPNKKSKFENRIDPSLDGEDVTWRMGCDFGESGGVDYADSESKDSGTQRVGLKDGIAADSLEAAGAAAAGTAAAGAGEGTAGTGTSSTAQFTPRFVCRLERWVHIVKYSFEGSILAAGCHDSKIYLFDVNNDYKLFNTLVGHSSFVDHLDFGLLLKHDHEEKLEKKKQEDGSLITTMCRVTELFDGDHICRSMVTTKTRTSTSGVSELLDSVTSDAPPREVAISEILIQSTSTGVGELLFWRAKASEPLTSATAVKNVWWATLSCPYGWPVQGIWPTEYDGSEINAVARSNSWDQVPVLSTVDSLGRVRLYNYPCVTPGAADKCYKGHASNVTNVKFSHDDAFCVTLGGTDKCIFVWKTDIQEEIRERAAYTSMAAGTATAAGVGILGLDSIAEDAGVLDEAAEGADDAPADEGVEGGDGFDIVKAVPTEGDQGSAVKPWKGAVREPSLWKDPPNATAPPQASLELKYVYGYRGWDCRNNLNFADSRFEVVYHIGATGIVLNTADNKQQQLHNTEHDDDILCLAVHPEGHTVATGETGKFPKIVLWDANTGVTIRVIMFHKRGVSNLAFSACGEILVSTGMDDDSMVTVHNWRTGSVLGKGKAGRGVSVYTLTVGGSEVFVTGGKNHIKFWTLPRANSPGGELSSKTGIYNIKSVKVRTVVSTAFLGQDVVSGMVDGSLLLWKDRSCTRSTSAHKGPVTAMYTISNDTPGIDSREHGPRIISGGKDGFVYIWDQQFRQVWSLNMNETLPQSVCPQIQAVATKENRLLIGTKASEIYEVSLLSNNEVYRLVQGHFNPRAELWGLAVHPSMHLFATCADDMTVRVWDSRSMQQVHVTELGEKLRALCFAPDGSRIAVATFEGKVVVLSRDLQTISAEVTLCNQWIQVVKYSPDGKLLAVGAHDSTIYLLETKSFSVRCRCRGHHSFITALDFSSDSKVLQSNSGDYELLFWDTETGKSIKSPTQVRDVHWATFSCSLGWPVQGVWPPHSDGTDVNSVDRSPDGQFLVSGDDNCLVKLFRYPCPQEHTQFKAYKGHAEHVMRVKFSYDGKYVYSVGGLDKAILQFELKNEAGKSKSKSAIALTAATAAGSQK